MKLFNLELCFLTRVVCIYYLYFLLIGCHSVTLKRLAAIIWAQLWTRTLLVSVCWI